ncbi:MAG: class I SAM-dependent methyltransferase [Spirochaetia bacterium]
MKDQFKDKAKDWDEAPWKRSMTQEAYSAITSRISIPPEARLLDLGGGTGLFALKFIHDVATITVVDTSEGMLDMLRQKIREQKLEKVEIINGDLATGIVSENSCELIISMMTMHHIEDVSSLFECFYEILVPGGSIAIVDLAKEDGDFHHREAVYVHNGFEKEDLQKPLEDKGFENIRFYELTKVSKESSKGVLKDYPIWLVIASK